MSKISPAEPVSELRKIKIIENGDPLVDFLENCPALVLDKPRFTYRRETVVRKAVADKLAIAASALPKGFKLAVVEGWRAPVIQQRMYLLDWNMFRERHPDWSEVAMKRVVNRFSAPMNKRVPPPHTTGAAVDLALLDEEGNRLEMSAPYLPHDPKGFPLHAPGLNEEARKHRMILSEAVIEAGITNYPSEFWHYSYGDQGWAYRGGHPNALYAAITPSNWAPDPLDVSDEPLYFIDHEPGEIPTTTGS